MPTNPDTLLRACITEVDRLLKLCDAGEPLAPVKVRPLEYDDWGWLRSGDDLFCCVRYPPCSSDIVAQEHRREGTDPYDSATAFTAAAVNLMRPALEDYKARLNNIEQSFHASSEPIWAAAILEPSVQSIARVLAANSPEIAAMVEVTP